jgi:hypothetical protein
MAPLHIMEPQEKDHKIFFMNTDTGMGFRMASTIKKTPTTKRSNKSYYTTKAASTN